jgi:hypothetical protein
MRGLTEDQRRIIRDVIDELNAEYGDGFIPDKEERRLRFGGKTEWVSVGGQGVRRVNGVLGLSLDSDMFVVADPRHMSPIVRLSQQKSLKDGEEQG